MRGPRSLLMTTAILAIAAACGDDGVHHLPDAPPVPQVTLSVDPGSVVIASGETVMVTATVVRTDFAGAVVVTPSSASGDLVLAGGTVAADATSIALTVTARGAAASGMLDVSVAGTADGVAITPAELAVTIAGRAGPPVGGQAAGDQAGSSVALSANGKRVIIGSPFHDTAGADAGRARVYERSGNTWTQVGNDLDGEAAGDRYGSAVAISDDGTRVAVGAYLNDGGGGASGHVRVFELVGTTWTQLGADLDGPASSAQGYSVALSATGSRVITGAPSANTVNGTTRVYEYQGTAWVQLGAAIAGGGELGTDVDISDDGSRIAVSSPSAQGANLPGSVQVYQWSGTAWTPLGPAVTGVVPAGFAGGSLALSSDATVLVVGAYNSDVGGTNAGEVRVYRWDPTATAWNPLGTALPGPAGSMFGTAVAISADGTRVLAGGPNGTGVVRLFTLVQGAWVQAGPDFGSMSDRSGAAVALSADGRTAAVGAPYADSPGNQSGAVRLYDLP